MKWIKYELHTTTKDADIIGEILLECGVTGYEITDHVPLTVEEERAMYTDIPADMGEDDGSSVLSFYLEAPENEEQIFFSTGSSLRDMELGSEKGSLSPEAWMKGFKEKVTAYQAFVPVAMPEILYSVHDDAEWKDKWKENFKPFLAADDILIKPSWEQVPDDLKDSSIVIEIDPGQAFGSGTHETTKLCLLLLRKYIQKDVRILDAGCGSGILTIASVLCGAKSVFCTDIDQAAVEAAEENAKRNGIGEEKIQVCRADILQDTEEVKKKLGGKVQMVVANILSDVIISLSNVVEVFLEEGGLFLSSGILLERAGEVEQAFRKNGLRVLEKIEMGEWCAFVCRLGIV